MAPSWPKGYIGSVGRVESSARRGITMHFALARGIPEEVFLFGSDSQGFGSVARSEDDRDS